MKRIFEDRIGWEPVHIILSPVSDRIDWMPAIRGWVHGWLSQRDSRRMCPNGCQTKYFDVLHDHDGACVRIQWLCDVCLQELLAAIENAFPEVERAEIGLRGSLNVRIKSDIGRFVAVSGRSITMDAGDKATVESFEICQYPVTVVQFEAFAAQTGYQTSAERQNKPWTYRCNDTLYSEGRRQIAEARFLSVEDGRAYCEFANMRLPTDSELLAAITIDDLERTISSRDRASLFRDTPRLLRLQGITLTSTCEGNLCVVRSGPWVTKHPGWNEDRKYKLLQRPDDAVGQMYVVSDEKGRRRTAFS